MEYRFDIFGNRVAIRRVGDDWQAFDLGNEGKRRKAGFVVPAFIEEMLRFDPPTQGAAA